MAARRSATAPTPLLTICSRAFTGGGGSCAFDRRKFLGAGAVSTNRCPQQFVESAELQELAPVEGARSAAAVEAWEQIVNRRLDAMAHFQAAILPPALRQSRSLRGAWRIAKKIWQETANTRSSRKPSSRAAGNPARPACRCSTTPRCRFSRRGIRLRSAAEAQIAVERQQFHLRKRLAHEFGAAIGRTVIDYDNLVDPDCREGRDHRRQVPLQQIPAVPIGDHHARRSAGGGSGGRRHSAEAATQAGEGQRKTPPATSPSMATQISNNAVARSARAMSLRSGVRSQPDAPASRTQREDSSSANFPRRRSTSASSDCAQLVRSSRVFSAACKYSTHCASSFSLAASPRVQFQRPFGLLVFASSPAIFASAAASFAWASASMPRSSCIPRRGVLPVRSSPAAHRLLSSSSAVSFRCSRSRSETRSRLASFRASRLCGAIRLRAARCASRARATRSRSWECRRTWVCRSAGGARRRPRRNAIRQAPSHRHPRALRWYALGSWPGPERHALDVVFQKQRNMRKDRRQFGRETLRIRTRARETDWRPRGCAIRA